MIDDASDKPCFLEPNPTRAFLKAKAEADAKKMGK
jgi:hypothetical protein